MIKIDIINVLEILANKPTFSGKKKKTKKPRSTRQMVLMLDQGGPWSVCHMVGAQIHMVRVEVFSIPTSTDEDLK
jgi:hypothetical protein